MSKPHSRLVPQHSSELSHAQRQLLALMQWMDYGRICGLRIRDGEPDLKAEVDFTRSLKICERPRPFEFSGNVQLKQKVVELFRKFTELGDGVIETLEVQAGLPFRIEIRHRLKLTEDSNLDFFAKT